VRGHKERHNRAVTKHCPSSNHLEALIYLPTYQKRKILAYSLGPRKSHKYKYITPCE
jgi:hypothetical protein